MKILKFLTLGILAASLTACGVAGPKGEKGDKGDQGIPGQTGPQGPAGQDGTDGQDGKDGVDGQDGKDGTDGLPGTDGATWLTGEQDPNDSDGKNGDLYLNTITFDIFLKANETWSKIGNIKGKDGIDGVDGTDGKDGKDGTNGVNGQDGKDGKDGTNGVNGQDGKNGADGLPGTDGATWLTGENNPSNDEGKNGDLYLNTTNFDIFTKIDGEWNMIGNIKGNPGENGHDADTYGKVYTVTFDAGEGHLIEYEETIEVNYGETIDLPLAERSEYVFTGWYTGFGVNDGKFTNVTPVTRDLTLYAGWEEDIKFYVYFNSNEGSSIAPQAYSALSTINSLPEPIKTDYTFAGWYLDEELNNRFSTPYVITKDVEVYAKWEIKRYTVSFNVNGGNPIEPVEFVAGDNVTGIADATKQYKTFAGWYMDSQFKTPFEDGFEIHSNITLYAKFNDNYVTFTFNSNGGSTVLSQQYVKGDYITSLPTPTKTSHTFNGWYFDSALTQKVSFPYQTLTDKTVYAKWTFVDPYPEYTKISSYSQLIAITDLTQKYVLIADIDCGGSELPMFGNLTGEINGDGHKIYNYNNTTGRGLFSGNSGVITKLELAGNYNANISSDDVGPFAIVNNASGTVSKCIFSGSLIATNNSSVPSSAGGLVGNNYGVISDCLNVGSMDVRRSSSSYGNNWCGAIAGRNYKTIQNCVNGSILTSSSSTKQIIYGMADHYETNVFFINCVSLTSAGKSSDLPITRSDRAATKTNCYFYSEAYSNVSSDDLNGQGNSISYYNVDSKYFYYNTVGLSSSIWSGDYLDVNSGHYIELNMNHLYVK